MSKQSGGKMRQFINWRMRVTLDDSRALLGTLMAFDKHMNVVLGDCEEFRTVHGKKGAEDREEKRSLGLVLLRGENVVSLSADAPPAPKSRAQQAVDKAQAPGVAKPAGRGGMPVVPPPGAGAPMMGAPGLLGPVRGVGGPAAGSMAPTPVAVHSGPVAYPGAPPPAMGPPGLPLGAYGRGMYGGPPPPMPMYGVPPPMPGPPGVVPPPYGMMMPPPPGPYGAAAPPPPGAYGRGMQPPPPPQQ